MHDAENAFTNSGNEFVIFYIGENEYCIDIMSLREIRSWTAPTSLPDSPPYVRGVINLRGAVVPIVDLALRLGLTPAEKTERSVIMITNIGDQMVGLSADAVSDILSIEQSDIQTPPQMSSPADNYFISGLFAMEKRMISIIDPVNILPSALETVAA